MRTRRSQKEMMMHILDAISASKKGELKISHIMLKANINCSLLKEMLTQLTENGLIESFRCQKETPKQKQNGIYQRGLYYRLTTKGIELIKAERIIRSTIGEPMYVY